MSVCVLSYGGGVQSTAMLILANRGELADYYPDAAVFANVGDDSERPQTLDYVRTWASVVSAIPVVEVQRRTRAGETRSLHAELTREGSRSVGIPVYVGGAPGRRKCTHDYKIAPIGKYLKSLGASADNPATVCIGISTDEIHRVNRKRAQPYENPVYPLIELGLDRSACAQLIEEAGWPNPGKSSCYFCPFQRPAQWAELRRDEPQLFASAAELEATLNATRERIGRDPVYLTRFGQPLPEAISEAQDMLPLFGAEWPSCDEGACWT
jgi:hypothetical protein